MRTWLSLALAAGAGLVSCGYSEEEWQAQLAKQRELMQQIAQERATIQQLEAELAARKGKTR